MYYLVFCLVALFNQPVFIDPMITRELKSKGTADIICVFRSGHQDLNKITKSFDSKNQKGEYVYATLKFAASKSQSEIVNYLAGNNVEYRAFYIINAIHIPFADALLVDYLSRQTSVLRLEYNSAYSYHRPLAPVQDIKKMETRGQIIQWGITRIKADTLWTLGFKGQGVVIGGEDTGVELHPLLKANYRGTIANNSINNNYNWHDAIHSLHPLNRDSTTNEYNNPCGLDTLGPCDDDNHGTHTMGTMNANDQQIGVAPEARWIACRCMERGWGTLATYIECFEWFLAPTNLDNKNPDPKKAPHVINNSWGCPPEEGCNLSNFATMDQVIKNLKAAGIFVAASAGNSGSRGCNSIDSPAAIFEASFTVGASNTGDSVAGFSSRGSVLADGSNRIKPNILAPGVGTLSSIRNGGLASFQGTSMAGPHVAGAVALLISAFPELAGKVELIEDILEKSAVSKFQRISCGNEKQNALPNNTYGFGILNVYKAYELARKLLTTGSNTNSLATNLKVYPNPAEHSIHFETTAGDAIVSIKIVDNQGKLVYDSFDINTPYLRVDHLLANGIYFYFAKTHNSSFNGKIVVVNQATFR